MRDKNKEVKHKNGGCLNIVAGKEKKEQDCDETVVCPYLPRCFLSKHAGYSMESGNGGRGGRWLGSGLVRARIYEKP